MRLWHVDMINVLPQKQLVSQWRECAAIVKKIKECGTPNHVLVNKVIEYHYSEFMEYVTLIYDELLKRGYNVSSAVLDRINKACYDVAWSGLPFMGGDS